MNTYCMFKGTLINAAPFLSTYVAYPHYVINVQSAAESIFKIVVNSASNQIGADGKLRLVNRRPARIFRA